MQIPDRAQRWLKGGIRVCSVPFFLVGLEFARIGVLFFFAPEMLREQGFRQDPSFGVRATGLLFFAGAGSLFAWSGWQLIRLARAGLHAAHVGAFAMIGLFWNSIPDGEPSLLNWTGLATSIGIVGYLSIPAVRRLFRASGHAPDN